MKACDSPGYLKLKQGMPLVTKNSQWDSMVKLHLYIFLKQTVYITVT